VSGFVLYVQCVLVYCSSLCVV